MPPSPSWIWHHPARAAAWAFALGGAGGAASLGALAAISEEWAYAPESRAEALRFAAGIAGAVVVGGAIWGGVVRAAVSLRGSLAKGLLAVALLAGSVLAALAIVIDGVEHPPISPTAGLLFAVFLSPLLLVSFVPVLRLARAAHAGAAGRELEVSAAGCAWAAVVAAVGVTLAPGPYFGAASGLALAAALFGLYRVYALARGEGTDGGRARATLVGGLRAGATGFALVSVVVVPLRLHEQAFTRYPGVMAISRRGIAGRCDLRAAGREGDVSLWLVDCGSSTGPTLGWDERAGGVLRDEALFERVPRLRSVPPYGTARP